MNPTLWEGGEAKKAKRVRARKKKDDLEAPGGTRKIARLKKAFILENKKQLGTTT